MLVETQDKALRRISELREQCSLEQQAKAHLESALRLEMDEMQCVIKTLTSKLSLYDTNRNEPAVLEVTDTATIAAKDNLIQLDAADVELPPATNLINLNETESDEPLPSASFDDTELRQKITELERQLVAKATEIHELSAQLTESRTKVKDLTTREEENTILLAENKLMIHSELENRDSEVKTLSKRLAACEKDLQLCCVERDAQKREIGKLLEEAKELTSKASESARKASQLDTRKKEFEAKLIVAESERTSGQMKYTAELQKMKQEQEKLSNDQQQLRTEMRHVTEAHAEASKQSAELQAVNKRLESECERFNQKIVELSETNARLAADKEELDTRYKHMFDERQQLQQRVDQLHADIAALNETNGSEAGSNEMAALRSELAIVRQENVASADEIVELRSQLAIARQEKSVSTDEVAALRSELVAAQQDKSVSADELTALRSDLASAHQQKTVSTEELATLKTQLASAHQEKSDTAADSLTLREKIDSLKNEKRDLEKTLEKEIRDKSELKVQVTNILQEIGRLEDQLKELRHSYAEIQVEKRALEERAEKQPKPSVTGAEAKSPKSDREQKLLQAKVHELERKHTEIMLDNAELAEQNRQLEHSIARLETNLADSRVECNAVVEQTQKLQVKLQQCLDENSKLFNAKELMEHEYRSLQDRYDTMDKEKLCVLDTNKCLETDLAAVRAELERERNRLEDDCDKMRERIETLQNENDALRAICDQLDKQLVSLAGEIATIGAVRDDTGSSNSSKSTPTKSAKSRDQAIADIRQHLKRLDGLRIEIESLKIIQCDFTRCDQERVRYMELFKAKDVESSGLQRQLANKDVQTNSLTAELAKSREQFKTTTFLHEELKAANTITADQMQSLVNKVGHLKQLNETFQTEMKKQKSLNDQLEQTNLDLTTQIGDVTDQLKVARDAAASQLADTVDRLQAEHVEHRETIDDLKQSLDEKQKNEVQLLATIETLKGRCSDFEMAAGQSVPAVTSSANDLEQIDRLKRSNEALKYELHEYRRTTESRIGSLNDEIEDLHENIAAYKEQLYEVEQTAKRTATMVASNGVESSTADHCGNCIYVDELNAVKCDRNELDVKLKKIMHEVQDVSNRNLFLEQKCENFLIMEQSNERLKLQNEKLSRQLDDTLVS